MYDLNDWTDHARHLTRRWVDELDVAGPPVDPLRVAWHLGYTVEWQPLLSVCLALSDPLHRSIVAQSIPQGDPEVWRHRIRFGIAHELWELAMPEVRCTWPEGADRVYQACASELLLPRAWLRRALQDRGPDPIQMARAYDVSAEAAGRSILDVDDCVLTIVDDGAVTTRCASRGFCYPRQPFYTELLTIDRAMETWLPCEERSGMLRVRAWPVEPVGAVRRVVALTWER